MNALLTENFRRQVCHLLEKTHTPRVTVRASQIPGAGNGVFYNGATEDSSISEDDGSIEVLCLYPGVYTPPLPLSVGMLSSLEDNNEVMDLYLAKKLPPSGIDFQENAYILNLGSPMGGYLDGCALTSSSGRRLDASSPACGHLVNHYGSAAASQRPSVQVVSFLWKDILTSESNSMGVLPNTMRCDGSPWYFDTMEQAIVYFSEKEAEAAGPTKVLDPLLAGAAITTRKGTRTTLQHGQELFLDYGLRKEALPKWAKDWYQ